MSGRTLGFTGLYIGIVLIVIVAGRALGIVAHPEGLFLLTFLFAVKIMREGLAEDEARYTTAFRDALDEIEWMPDPVAESIYSRWLQRAARLLPEGAEIDDAWVDARGPDGRVERVWKLYKEEGEHER